MSLEKVARAVAGRLSLRQPQTDSLNILHTALEAVPALRDAKARSQGELKAMQLALQGQFPTLTDFEREFPSMCFALATGVGKTRLMGAFISYLNAAYRYKHFFILAPNLTIYDKLIRDFTPNTPKYVFKGIAEFASNVPEVITGETYMQTANLSLVDAIQINIFNISKINAEVRGGKAPKIKRLSEYLGQSYFDYLATLPDLILIMDESHRYRAGAGVRALNELKPLLGLEVTATPFVEAAAGKTVPFKNVVMDYPLARAIEDGFVKEPSVVTQQDFQASDHSAEQLEVIKLKDGIRVHEETKVHLQTYHTNTGAPSGSKPVKPFMLVIARDTTHASQLLAQIQSDSFFNGNYKGKVIQVDSSRSGADEEEMIRRLLEVENYDEPTEIVIHVNMLKEGWDVTNLYTIVPLRAANARTLIEQSIGRGLRLPYGRKTGVEAVDRLNIIAHDRFQEVIAEANKADSPIRLKQLKLDPTDSEGNRLTSYTVPSTLDVLLGISCVTENGAQQPLLSTDAPAHAATTLYSVLSPKPGLDAAAMFTGAQQQIARVAKDVIAELSRDTRAIPSSLSLAAPHNQAQIAALVQKRLVPTQGQILQTEQEILTNVAAVVQQTVTALIQHTIDVPRITVVPTGVVESGYRPFALDITKLRYQPLANTLESHGLQSKTILTYGQAAINQEARFEDYIVRGLIDYDDVSYDDHADFLYQLAKQAVDHFKTYLVDDDAIHNVLANYGKPIAEIIRNQMAVHYFEESTGSEVVVKAGFVPLKDCGYTFKDDIKPLDWLPADKGTIKKYLYGGFTRCAYPLQKFDSDTERILAIILERKALCWYKPMAGQFNIYYRDGAKQPEYVPDFVVKLSHLTLLVETKKASEVRAAEEAETVVKAKAVQASLWCKHATEFTGKVDGNPWKYLLIPHNAVAENMSLENLIVQYEVR